MSDKPPPVKRRPLAGLRASFLTGLIVVLPIGLTIYLIWTVIGWIDSWVLPFVPSMLQPDVLLRDFFGADTRLGLRGAGVIVFLVFTILIGWMAKGFLGRSFLGLAERLVDRMPIVRSIYNGIKQIAETVFAQSNNSFEQACLVEFPRRDVWAIGFISTKAKGEIEQKLNDVEKPHAVFIPTTPNPTSGFMVFVPEKDIRHLDMSIEDTAKLVISAGLLYPNGKGGVVQKLKVKSVKTLSSPHQN
ncbi:MAG: DUF502 domain-containing protein [Paracoccaceae bacterium]|jgi:uncharacterized membrane protein